MRAFWRETELSEAERDLLEELLAAHHQAVFRGNISSITVGNAMGGSGDYCKAIAAGILTLGAMHAPIAQTMRLLSDEDPVARAGEIINDNLLVPGWGNSFIKGEPDQMWAAVEGRIEAISAPMMQRIGYVTRYLHGIGKQVYPNPSTYTAAAALILDIPESVAPFLLIMGRLQGWTELTLRV